MDFDKKEICAICGQRFGLHSFPSNNCPVPFKYLETTFSLIAPPPTTEEAELWKQVAADISGATSYITIEVAKGDWKTAEDIVNKLYENLQQKYSLSRRSEQPTELPLEYLNEFYKKYIDWWVSEVDAAEIDFTELDKLLRYLRKSGTHLSQQGFYYPAEQNSEAIEFKNWCEENESILDIQQQHTHTTTELYKIFKKQKP